MTHLSASQRAGLSGLARSVVFPGDAAYPGLATAWNLAVPVTPAAIVALRDADEVARVVAFAAAERIPVAVQATGHGAVSDNNEGILLVTAALDEVTLHASERWVRVGAGVRWRAVVEAAAPHGLVGLMGSSGGSGVVGYTTGGGHGPLARTHGLQVDRVRAFEVVTGDGVRRRATATEEPDLFWGLRGGKGALGVVTALEFDLLAIPTLYGGAVWFDASDLPAVLRAWADWCPGLPIEATTSLAILQVPDAAPAPAVIRGRMTVSVRFAWDGDPGRGEAALAPIRAAASPILDTVSVMPSASVETIHADPEGPLPFHAGSLLLDRFDGAAADALAGVAGPGSGSPLMVCEVRQLGGAIAAEPAVASAFARRDAAYCVNLVGPGMPPGRAAVAERIGAVRAALGPWTGKGALANFEADVDQVRFMRVFPPDVHVRLAGIARTCDPNGILVAGRGLR